MAKLQDILIYILKKYPYKNELSNARLTKMVYLADWYNSIHHDKQISNISWYFDNYGPFVWDIYSEVKQNEIFDVKITSNLYGKEKKLIKLNKEVEYKLKNNEKESLKKIIKITKDLNFEKFIKLVYSTYPILTTEKYNKLKLKHKAKEFKEKKAQQNIAQKSVSPTVKTNS